jgi:L-threonylcarbamoyladenylate synthase
MPLTLAIETSSINYEVALGAGGRILATASGRRQDPDFVGLGGLARQCLHQAGRELAELGLIAVDVGPGNLGAVRVAVAYANGLAFSLGRPVFQASSMELLRDQTRTDGVELPLLAAQNAGGGLAYLSHFDGAGDGTHSFGKLTELLRGLAPRFSSPVGLLGPIGARLAAGLGELGVETVELGLDYPRAATLFTTSARLGTDPSRIASLASPVTESSEQFQPASDAVVRVPDAAELDQIAARLLAGATALLPTDTVYGLFAHPQRPEAVARIFALKDRPVERVLPVLVADAEQVKTLGGELTEAALAYLAGPHMPGPLTLVVPLRNPPAWLGERVELGFRIPADAWLRELLRRTGPMYATSANRNQGDTGRSPGQILPDLVGEPDLVLDLGPRSSVSSALVHCGQTPPRLLRAGDLARAAIHSVHPLAPADPS